jgi:hypothetical protein
VISGGGSPGCDGCGVEDVGASPDEREGLERGSGSAGAFGVQAHRASAIANPAAHFMASR